MAQGKLRLNLLVGLEFDKRAYKAASRQTLVFTLTNESDQALQVLRWNTPLDGFKSDMFHVENDGVQVPYLGRVYKRAAPEPEDYLLIQPGETVQHAVNFLDAYDVAATGHYRVRYRTHKLHAGSGRQAALAKGFMAQQPSSLSVRANIATFEQIEGRKPKLVGGVDPTLAKRLRAASPARKVPTFSGCSAAQQGQLKNALTEAAKMAAAARDALQGAVGWARPNAPRYREWFGIFDKSRFDTVCAHYANIADALANKTVTFLCDCTDSAYAYVYPSKPYEIHLCKAFWAAPLTGSDSQAGTLVHETSHFNVVAGTDDHSYGQSACRALAKNTPSEAIDNADSHEYFAENTPALTMQPAPGSIFKTTDNWHNMPAGFAGGFNASLNGAGSFAGKCYFFKGNSYIRYDWSTDKVDPGYPKSIAANWHGMPTGFTAAFDDAVNGKGPFQGKCYFFKGDSYVRYDWSADKADAGYPKKIAGNWNGLPTGFKDNFDAILNGNGPFAGKLYFFKGDKYIRYDWSADKVDPGYPKVIADNWHCLPAGYVGSFDTALEGDGPFSAKGYFFKADKYVRYNWANDCAEI
jgi:peptidyl-Lys metalloendopeptidase